MNGTKRIVLIFICLSITGLLEMINYTQQSDHHSSRSSKLHAATPGLQGSSLAASRSMSTVIVEDSWKCPYPKKTLTCPALTRLRQAYASKHIVACLWDDNSGSHPEQLSQFNKPTQFFWNRNCDPLNPQNLFALTSLTHEDQTRECCGNDTYRVFISTEPPAIQPQLYEYLKVWGYDYDFILSLGGPDVVEAPNIFHWSWGSSWVPLEEWSMYPKSKLCSIIASNNRFAPGHMLRHNVVKMLNAMQTEGNNKFAGCEILGRGYKNFGPKKEGLQDYMYSLIIENSITGNYMTEKVMDSLACGTIPVYWGTNYTKDTFGDAIITWNTMEELKDILPTLTEERYKAMLPAVQRAQEKAREFVPPERWIWKNLFECAYDYYTKHDECYGPTGQLTTLTAEQEQPSSQV